MVRQGTGHPLASAHTHGHVYPTLNNKALSGWLASQKHQEPIKVLSELVVVETPASAREYHSNAGKHGG